MSCDCSASLARELGQSALFDEGVETARNACVAGASLAAAAIAASAWYDNPLTGTGALRECLARLRGLAHCADNWARAWGPIRHPDTGDPDWVPGFGFITTEQASAVSRAAVRLHGSRRGCCTDDHLGFYVRNRAALTPLCGDLNATGLAALVFADHALASDAAERKYLLARLDVAMLEASRARAGGIAAFPFFSNEYRYEGTSPSPRKLDLGVLMKRVGL